MRTRSNTWLPTTVKKILFTSIGLPMLIGVPSVARASGLSGLLSSPTMTGDWGGARTRLLDDGFSFYGEYIGEYANSFSGGMRQGADYAQQFFFGSNVDLQKIANINGGTFHIGFIQRQGRSTSADYTGNEILVQEQYGSGENFRITALNYEQKLFQDKLDIKVGMLAEGDDFESIIPITCTFQSVGFCGHPLSLPYNSNWVDFPNARWATEVRWQPTQSAYVEAGVFDANFGDYSRENGLKIGLSGSTGVVIPVQFGIATKFGPDALAGHYSIGGYYETSSVAAVAADAADENEMHSGAYGGFFSFDQMLYSFEPGTARGLTGFVQGTVTDSETSLMPVFWHVGFVARGPIPSRPNDFFNVGFVRANVNQRALAYQRTLLTSQGIANFSLETGENDVEFGYGFKATPWLLIHPNFIYVDNPGAFSYKHYPVAWVFGLQTAITF